MKIVQNFGDSENLDGSGFPYRKSRCPSACKLAKAEGNRVSEMHILSISRIRFTFHIT